MNMPADEAIASLQDDMKKMKLAMASLEADVVNLKKQVDDVHTNQNALWRYIQRKMQSLDYWNDMAGVKIEYINSEVRKLNVMFAAMKHEFLDLVKRCDGGCTESSQIPDEVIIH